MDSSSHINDIFKREISLEEEEHLWLEHWSQSGQDTHVKLVELYLPLVAQVANKMPQNVRQNVSLPDLLSSGVLGLHDAISNFSKDKGVPFSAFAYKRIKGAILDELRSQDPLTRTQRNYYREICTAINNLTIKFQRPPTDEEIAAETNMSISDIDRYIGMGRETINLNDEFQNGLSYIDVIEDESSPSPREVAHRTIAIEQLFKQHFRKLDEREQKLLFLRYFEELSVKEIAKIFEISEGRISQIFQKIILKLRALMQCELH